jgi:hypothetical protein
VSGKVLPDQVEHVFRVIKCQFGYTKVRYKGLAKNAAQVFMLVGQGWALDGGAEETRVVTLPLSEVPGLVRRGAITHALADRDSCIVNPH